MQDKQIIGLYFARKESAIAETDIKYGRYCLTVANNILRSSEDSEESHHEKDIKNNSGNTRGNNGYFLRVIPFLRGKIARHSR